MSLKSMMRIRAVRAPKDRGWRLKTAFAAVSVALLAGAYALQRSLAEVTPAGTVTGIGFFLIALLFTPTLIAQRVFGDGRPRVHEDTAKPEVDSIAIDTPSRSNLEVLSVSTIVCGVGVVIMTIPTIVYSSIVFQSFMRGANSEFETLTMALQLAAVVVGIFLLMFIFSVIAELRVRKKYLHEVSEGLQEAGLNLHGEFGLHRKYALLEDTEGNLSLWNALPEADGLRFIWQGEIES